MISYSKKILGFFVLSVFILIFSFSGKLFAQEYGQFLDEMGTTNAPSLFVDSIKIPTSAETGKTISGSFSLFNVGKQAADQVSHKIHFITMINNQGDLYPLEIITSSEMSATYAMSNGNSVKDFTLSIPATLPEEEYFGVYVEIFVNNSPVTYEHAALTVLGNKVTFLDISGMLRVGSEDFFVLEGPTITSAEIPELVVNVASERSYTTIIPTISIYKGPTVTQNSIRQLTSPTFSLDVNEVKEEVYQLPTDVGPGVYTVVVSYTNQQGDALSAVLEARYVVAGLDPIIQNVSYNDLNQNLIDNFVVSVLYVDAPLNARLDASGNFVDSRAEYVFVRPGGEAFDSIGYPLPENISAIVKLTNTETGKVIDEKTVRNASSNPIDVSFKPIHGTSNITVTISLLEGEKVVDVYESLVEIIPSEKGKMTFLDLLKNNMQFLFVFILGIVVVGLVSIFIKRRKVSLSK